MFFEVQKNFRDAFHKKYRNIVFKKKYYLQRYKFQKKIIEVRKKTKPSRNIVVHRVNILKIKINGKITTL